MFEKVGQVDGLMMCHGSPSPAGDDTRDLQVRRCGACGSLLFFDVDAEPSSICSKCTASAVLGWPNRRSGDFRCPCCLDSGVVEVQGRSGGQERDADTEWRPCKCEQRVRDLVRFQRVCEGMEVGSAAPAEPIRGSGWEMSGRERCDVCGVPLGVDERDRTWPTCWTCDLKVGTAIARLVMKGHRPPLSWRKVPADDT